MARPLRWGIIGLGKIAVALARGISRTPTGTLLAVASRSQEKADAFAKQQGAAKAYGSYEALLADKEVDCVYIATPHPVHVEWAIKAAEAGKHILCEKPVALNAWQAMAAIDAAERAGVFFMEAFMYRCHPQTAKVIELVKSGAIGEVRMIRASFGFNADSAHDESRILCNAMGGGGIMDVGCYPVSFARLIAGAVSGKPFADPVDVAAAGHIGKTRIDDSTAAVLRFENGIVADVSTSVRLGLENEAVIYGSKGRIHVPSPWIVAKEGGTTQINVGKEVVTVESTKWLYEIEAETVANAIAAGKKQADGPAMSWDDTIGNLKTLDRWRAAIGLVFDEEQPANQTYTASRRPLARSAKATIPTAKLPGVGDKAISKLVMGCDNQRDMNHAAVVFDAFFEAGGTCFDTAHIYLGGTAEQRLGHWVKNRGVREQVVIIGKGAHTPFCDPKSLTKQLEISLERQQTNYFDLYFMHRDNLEVPVGEFVDVLNEHQKAGRIRAFGGSNWTRERVEAFNADAKKKGLAGMSAVSNNFSLARMVDPPWAGCIASSTDEWRAWLEKTQTALFPWSSQARGFFVPGRSLDEPEIKRCWVSAENMKRRERAFELAKKRGVEPVQIALAYVLHQAFPVFALFGPRDLKEMRSSLAGLGVRLTKEEVGWLDLR